MTEMTCITKLVIRNEYDKYSRDRFIGNFGKKLLTKKLSKMGSQVPQKCLYFLRPEKILSFLLKN